MTNGPYGSIDDVFYVVGNPDRSQWVAPLPNGILILTICSLDDAHHFRTKDEAQTWIGQTPIHRDQLPVQILPARISTVLR